ncbi:hypothetical protein ACVIGA_003140 [Bradyrhizobium sp. USDA 3240]
MTRWKPLWTLIPGSRLDADHPETGSLFHAETQAWRRVCPVIESADRHLASNRRVESDSPPAPPSSRNFNVDQHPIDRRRAQSCQQRTLCARWLQPAMPLECGQQHWDHRYEALTADAIGGFPQRDQRVAHAGIFASPTCRWFGWARCPFVQWWSGPVPSGNRQCSHRVLAVPTRRCCQLVKDPSLLHSSSRTVAPRHRGQHLAPCAHADPARHWRHRPDSVTPPQSSAELFGNIFDEAIRGVNFGRRSPGLGGQYCRR